MSELLAASDMHILGELTYKHGHDLDPKQRDAWLAEIAHLKDVLEPWHDEQVYFEFAIPRMGKRADVVVLMKGVVVVLEYKVNSRAYASQALEQAMDYALDLKNFHSGSEHLPVVPVLVGTHAPDASITLQWFPDRVAHPLRTNTSTLSQAFRKVITLDLPAIDPDAWETAPYRPTPTIVEAARALYKGHDVREISRSDAGAINLSRTSAELNRHIEESKRRKRKTICFVTGVPGSGKTLAGLNLAIERGNADENEHAVFLSGNGPLVAVLREALAADEYDRAKSEGQKLTKSEARQRASVFIQNIHHFRDDNLETQSPPIERVVVFDEAQRAWTRKQTSKFMREKRQQQDFDMSEPQFLLSVMDRHPDWCVVVCLIGGGQEINTGEAGMSEWVDAIRDHYPHWQVAYSDRICEQEYSWGSDLSESVRALDSEACGDLHLAVNIRSFRAESVSAFVAEVIKGDAAEAAKQLRALSKYPIVLTRSLDAARDWLRNSARGSERYGLVASSGALRLKPIGIHVKAKIDPRHWFLDGRDDVRSSFALEDAATEFDVQGLELDWACVCWDADFRRTDSIWDLKRFSGTRWQDVREPSRRRYLANAYRVLLTRARQGMVLLVPHGDSDDATRLPEFYDRTFDFLRQCGVPLLSPQRMPASGS